MPKLVTGVVTTVVSSMLIMQMINMLSSFSESRPNDQSESTFKPDPSANNQAPSNHGAGKAPRGAINRGGAAASSSPIVSAPFRPDSKFAPYVRAESRAGTETIHVFGQWSNTGCYDLVPYAPEANFVQWNFLNEYCLVSMFPDFRCRGVPSVQYTTPISKGTGTLNPFQSLSFDCMSLRYPQYL